jgi:hypothetical protein
MAQTIFQRSRAMSAVEKASFHMETGRVLRKFFGLSEADEQAIEKELDIRVQVNLDREGSRSA